MSKEKNTVVKIPPRHVCNLAPNSYFPDKPRKHIPGIDFKRKLEMEEFSKNLGYKHPRILKEREEMRRNLGPCWHNPVDLTVPIRPDYKCLKVKEHGTFGKRERFPDDGNKIPGPGTYSKGHRDFILRQMTPMPPFLWSSSKRFLTHEPSWSLAPNRYHSMKDFLSISEFIKRRVSKRGPYDIFSGPRDKTTTKSHGEVENWPYTLLTHLQILLNDKYKGRVGDLPRDILLPTVTENEIGPADYNPIYPWEQKIESKRQCGFKSCKFPARPKVNFSVFPGPGRYNIVDRRKMGGAKCVFLSKVPRYFDRKPQTYRAFCIEG